jgi:hypothetical protein
MANFLYNLGLGSFMESDEDMNSLLALIVTEGEILSGYGNTAYINYHFGGAQLIARMITKESGQGGEIVGLDTHGSGKCVWEVRLSSININPKDADETQRVCVLKRVEDGSGMVVAHIVNANVLPSFLEDDIVKLQMIGFGVVINFFATEDEYAESCDKLPNGGKILLSDGMIMPNGFLYNHDPERAEEEKDYSTDAYALIRGTVKDIIWGMLSLPGGEPEKGYIRCFIDTQYGELELVFSPEQVNKSELDKMETGSIISGIFVLSGDAGIYEYDNGVIYDEEHNLRVLRYCFIEGNAERTRSVFNNDAVYDSKSSNKQIAGNDGIINYLQYVIDSNSSEENQYFAHMAKIISIDDNSDESPEYAVGKRCIVLAKENPTKYESIAFIDVDDNGKITKLSFSIDPRYHFCIDELPKPPSVFDDIELPNNVYVPMINRARFHGLLDESIADTDITELFSDYRAYCFNTEQMLKFLEKIDEPEKEKMLQNIFGYLFAKETERYINEVRKQGRSGLTVNYTPEHALAGEIYSELSEEEHLLLRNLMDLGKQFYKDYIFFVKKNENAAAVCDDVLDQALITAQRIGYLHGEKFLDRLNSIQNIKDYSENPKKVEVGEKEYGADVKVYEQQIIEITNALLSIPADFITARYLLAKYKLPSMILSVIACKIGSECFCEGSDVEGGDLELTETEMNSYYLYDILQLLIDYRMNPNDVVGKNGNEDNIMMAMQYVDYKDMGLKCMALLLENGGDVHTKVDSETIIGDAIFDAFFAITERSDSPANLVPQSIKWMLTLVAHDEKTNTDTEFIIMKNGYTPEFVKTPENYYCEVEWELRKGSINSKKPPYIFVYDKNNGMEVAEIL